MPDGVEIREYQRHGDGRAFHVALALARPLPLRWLRARGPTRLEYKATFYVVRDLDLWGQPSFWAYQPPLHHCPGCGRRQRLLPPFKRRDVTYTYRFPSGTSRPASSAARRRRWHALGISAETVALIVANQIADQGAKQVDPGRVVQRIGLDEISLKKRHKLYATILTDLTDPGRPVVLAVAAGRDRAAAETCLRKLSEEQRRAVATHCTDMSPAYLSAGAGPAAEQPVGHRSLPRRQEAGGGRRRGSEKVTRDYKRGLNKEQRKQFRARMWEFRRRPQDLMAEPAEGLEALFQEVPALRVIYQLRHGT